MKVLLLNLLILGLSSLWMGCDCDQAGGKMQGKQCSSDAGGEDPTTSGVVDNNGGSVAELDGMTVRTPLDVSWDAVDGAAYYMIRLHEEGGDCSATSDIFETRVDAPETSATIDPENIEDGTYLLCVVAYDEAGNLLQPIQSATITIDNTAPTVELAEYLFNDDVGKVDFVFALPSDTSDWVNVTLYRSQRLGAMPACGEGEVAMSWEQFDTGVLNHTDNLTADNAGYAYNYNLCGTDAIGNVSQLPMSNVRGTLIAAHHKAFVTEATPQGNFGGIAAADAICQGEADTAGLSGEFKAVLSDNATSIANHINLFAPVRNVAGTLVGRSAVQLSAGATAGVLGFHADGDPVSGGNYDIWTGAAANGAQALGNNCLNWSSNDGGQRGAFGDVQNPQFYGATAGAGDACSAAKRLLCMDQHAVMAVKNTSIGATGTTINSQFDVEATAEAGNRAEVRRNSGASAVDASCLNPSDEVVAEFDFTGFAFSGGDETFNASDATGAEGRYSYRVCVFDKYGGQANYSFNLGSERTTGPFGEVFVTSEAKGIDSVANATCSDAASNAKLGGTWVAFASLGGGSAMNSLTSAQPLFDLNGTSIAANGNNSFGSGLDNGILISQYGSSVVDGSYVWTGSNNDGSARTGTTPGHDCDVWTDSGIANGAVGVAGATDGRWVRDGSNAQACDSKARLYCISQ